MELSGSGLVRRRGVESIVDRAEYKSLKYIRVASHLSYNRFVASIIEVY